MKTGPHMNGYSELWDCSSRLLFLFPSKAWSVAFCSRGNSRPVVILSCQIRNLWNESFSFFFILFLHGKLHRQTTQWMKLGFPMGWRWQFPQFALVMVPMVIFYVLMLYRSGLCVWRECFVWTWMEQSLELRCIDSMDLRSE